MLLLWEADHQRDFPSRASVVGGRLSAFTKRLKLAVAGDDQLKPWLVTRQLARTLSPGLPMLHYLFWTVHIEVPAGHPFLGLWKAHLSRLAHQRQAVFLPVVAGDRRPPRKKVKAETQPHSGDKRKREGLAPSPRLPQKKARTKIPTALQASVARQAGESVSPSSSYFSSSSCGSSSFGAGGPPAGALT